MPFGIYIKDANYNPNTTSFNGYEYHKTGELIKQFRVKYFLGY